VVYSRNSLKHLQADGPIYKGIFSDICPLLSAPDFFIMIDPAFAILPSPFSRLYASCLSALCQGKITTSEFWGTKLRELRSTGKQTKTVEYH
jgi:hypothetical protein